MALTSAAASSLGSTMIVTAVVNWRPPELDPPLLLPDPLPLLDPLLLPLELPLELPLLPPELPSGPPPPLLLAPPPSSPPRSPAELEEPPHATDQASTPAPSQTSPVRIAPPAPSLLYDRGPSMHVTPAGFTFLPGTERTTPGQTSRVFGVARAGEEHLCKRLGSRALDEPWMRERLVAEGRLLALLGGRAAPRLVASGEDAHGPWFVMERIAWPPLASYMGTRDADWMESATGTAFDALATVHAAGVVHGDVSPDNVLVSGNGARAVLVDFGLALAPTTLPLPPGPFRGTLVYAAPEVARGEPFDGRADLFAMAASLLHVWSGKAPRAQASDAAMLLGAGEEGVEAWAERAAGGLAPEVARALVMRCSFDAKERVA
jgi:hypothetical protein